MTALAMIIGMAPMALGLGEGGEQNAPLGRAVIGGLIFATLCDACVRAGRFQHRFMDARPSASATRPAPRRPPEIKSMPETSNPLHYVMPRRLRLVGLVAGAIAIVVVVVGLVTRVMASREVDSWTQANHCRP